MPSDESEKKGRVYEAFVKLAVEKVINIRLCWEEDIPGVLANQDFSYPSSSHPELVIAVTYWGSHETANKKFWRTVEDRFEVYCAFPAASFLSIVFEKNKDSDDALDDILKNICLGKELSERYSSAILPLQEYVNSDEAVSSFGAGKEGVFSACERKYETEEEFRTLINILGEEIKQIIQQPITDYLRWVPLLEEESASQSRRTNNLILSGCRNTYYKKGLIRLLQFSKDEVQIVLSAIEDGSWDAVDDSLIRRLISADLIKKQAIGGRITVSNELRSISAIGSTGYGKLAEQVGQLVEGQDPTSDFPAYLDHYNDITKSSHREALFAYFCAIRSSEDIERSLHGVDGAETQRIWVVDYYLALKRAQVRGGKYGMKKLSQRLGIPYIGGISPLPSFVSGDLDAISCEKKQELFQYISEDITTFDFEKISPETIVHDRTITLMKKFNILELLTKNALLSARISPEWIKPNCNIRNPYAENTGNEYAGRTEFNYSITANGKAVYIFIVSAYDASHKHKEIAGRNRTMKVSPDINPGNNLSIVILDGTLLSETPEKKIKIMYKAGWDYLFYADELELMANTIYRFLHE